MKEAFHSRICLGFISKEDPGIPHSLGELKTPEVKPRIEHFYSKGLPQARKNFLKSQKILPAYSNPVYIDLELIQLGKRSLSLTLPK